MHRKTNRRATVKTSTLPPLRVSPQLRAEAEAVLAPGESLSSFVHEAVARTIEFRRAQQEFVERGLASAERSRASGHYVTPEAALRSLRRQVTRAKRRDA